MDQVENKVQFQLHFTSELSCALMRSEWQVPRVSFERSMDLLSLGSELVPLSRIPGA